MEKQTIILMIFETRKQNVSIFFTVFANIFQLRGLDLLDFSCVYIQLKV